MPRYFVFYITLEHDSADQASINVEAQTEKACSVKRVFLVPCTFTHFALPNFVYHVGHCKSELWSLHLYWVMYLDLPDFVIPEIFERKMGVLSNWLEHGREILLPLQLLDDDVHIPTQLGMGIEANLRAQ